MAASFLLFVNLGVTFLHIVAYLQEKNVPRGAKNRPFLARVMTPDNLHFGGMQMLNGRWWTIITASFAHAGNDHLVNNMIHFLGFASALDTVIGGVRGDFVQLYA